MIHIQPTKEHLEELHRWYAYLDSKIVSTNIFYKTEELFSIPDHAFWCVAGSVQLPIMANSLYSNKLAAAPIYYNRLMLELVGDNVKVKIDGQTCCLTKAMAKHMFRHCVLMVYYPTK